MCVCLSIRIKIKVENPFHRNSDCSCFITEFGWSFLSSQKLFEPEPIYTDVDADNSMDAVISDKFYFCGSIN